MKHLLKFTLVAFMLTANQTLFSQTNEEVAIVNFYRLEESMMSGGRSLNVKVYFNDKEVGSMLTNTKMIYKCHTTGSVKIKCVADFGGSGVGSPWVETMNLEKGKEYHISVAAGSMTGVKGEVLEEKKLKKITSNKFADTVEVEEK